MRIFALALALVCTVAACDSGGNHDNQHPDLSTADDLSVVEIDFGPNFAGDLSISPDLTPLTPSQMIQAVRMAGDTHDLPDGGMLTMSIPVAGVYVTYLKPNIAGQTEDLPGFFVQADPTGPAVFIRVDPASLSPVPLVGDLVQFTVTGADVESGVHEATYIADWAVASSGHDLTAMVQDLSSATDLVSGLNNYESELSRVTGTVDGDFATSGDAYLQALMTTAALPGPAGLPKLRLPGALRDSLDVSNGCVLTVGPTPLWRFTSSAQPSGWVSGDVAIASCPAPKVVSASATSATSVVVNFDRSIDMTTLTAGAFAFASSGNAITASAATLTGLRQVTVTTNSQGVGQLYALTVAASVKDMRAVAVDAAHDTAQFHGFGSSPATLRINEFNPAIANNYDLVELRAITGGTVNGFTFQQGLTAAKATVLATLPDQVVATNDLIVLHITPNPSPTPAPSNEIGSETDCGSSSCYSGAWDATGTSDIGNSARVLVIKDASGNIQDGLAFFNTALTGFGLEVSALIAAGQWTAGTNCDGTACSDTDAKNVAISVTTATVGSTTAKSARRTSATDNNDKADWAVGTSSFGVANP